MADEFRGRSIVVTGASDGIGRALALDLASRGAKLTLAARSLDALESAAEACRQAGGEAIAVSTDVSDREACREMIGVAADAHGGIDMLVNNAGMSMVARFDEVSDLDVFERLLQVNYLGSVYCTHFAIEALKRSRGLIVAVSSLAGKTGIPNRTGYAASKHAMQGFFDSLRIELAGDGVDVLVVSPGIVDTNIHSHSFGADGSPRNTPSRPAQGAMSVDECVALTLRAMARRKRELVMTSRGKLGLWLKLVAPGVVDGIAARTIAKRDG